MYDEFMMYNYSFSNWNLGGLSPFIWLMMIMELILKGFALYRSAQRQQTVWFIALLVVNSAGILPLIYLLIHQDFQSTPVKTTVAKKSTRRK